MRFMDNIRQRQPIIYAIVIILVFLMLHKIVGGVVESITNFPYYYQKAFHEFITVLIAVVMMFFSNTYKQVLKTQASIGETLKVSAFELCMTVLIFTTCIAENLHNELRPLNDIIIFLIYFLLVGIVEEVIFRGIIENILLERYGTDYKGVLISVFVSGGLFGMAHLSNFSLETSLSGVVIQSLQCIGIGIYYGAIYARTHNIYGLIFLHAISDIAAVADSGLWGIGTVESSITDLGLLNIFSVIIYLIPTIYILRKERVMENL